MTTAALRGLAPARDLLSNGTVVTVKESRTTPAVSLSAAFRAGSAHDSDGHLGLAYFASRVIDRGTPGRGADEIAEALDRRGVSLNVTVTRHQLTLACTCLAEDFEPMLELVGDVAMHPTFPDEEIATRRGEIVTAIRQDEDNPAVVAVERLFSLLYPGGHPYGRRVKGTFETVNRIDRTELQRFHQERFGPRSLSLVVVGDVDSGRAREAAARVFGEWTGDAGHAPPLPPVAPRGAREHVVIPMMNKAQADVAYGFVTIARADPAYYAFTILNNVLGQYSLGGRLGDNIRERQGMAYYVFSSFDASVAEGPLLIRSGVNPANVDRAVQAIDEEIARIAAEGVTEKELADSKRYLIGSIPRTLETNAAIANFLQTAEFFGLGLDYDLRLPGLLDAVTRDEANEIAARFLSPDRAAVVIAGPYQGD